MSNDNSEVLEIKIESGIQIPRPGNCSEMPAKIKAAITTMKPGDSFLVPKAYRTSAWQVAKSLKLKLITRIEGKNSVRCWIERRS